MYLLAQKGLRVAARSAMCGLLLVVPCCRHEGAGGTTAAPGGGLTVTLDETSNDSEVTVSVGETLEIVLSEGRTAGYRWTVASDGAPVCRLQRDRYEAPPQPPGAPGRHAWTFAAVAAGYATISLAYGRSFGGTSPTRAFTVRVIAR
jgi:predicted secreted protein